MPPLGSRPGHFVQLGDDMWPAEAYSDWPTDEMGFVEHWQQASTAERLYIAGFLGVGTYMVGDMVHEIVWPDRLSESAADARRRRRQTPGSLIHTD